MVRLEQYGGRIARYGERLARALTALMSDVPPSAVSKYHIGRQAKIEAESIVSKEELKKVLGEYGELGTVLENLHGEVLLTVSQLLAYVDFTKKLLKRWEEAVDFTNEIYAKWRKEREEISKEIRKETRILSSARTS